MAGIGDEAGAGGPGLRPGVVSPTPGSPCRGPRQGIRTAVFAMFAGAMLLAGSNAGARAKTLLWKPVTQALLKENNQPVKTWNVYQPEKNRDWLLVQVNKDWYILNLKQKRVYPADRSDFQARGDSLTGPQPDANAPVLKISDWDSHDVGPAQQITVRLGASGDVLAIELPHPLEVY
jgi:hypothetical protein